MRRLNFNYAQGNVPAPANLCLGLGLCLGLTVLVGGYRHLMTENTMLQQQLEAKQLAAAPTRPLKTTAEISPALAAEVNEVQAHIHTPWLPLLQALEQAHQPNLYWMQLAPDVKRKHIRMTVLASNRQQGWALVDRLKQQSGLSDVKLKASESSEVNGQLMTTLHVEAGWKF
jgi:hypothetical protein